MRSGLDVALSDPQRWLQGLGRVGFVVNQSTVSWERGLEATAALLQGFAKTSGSELVCVFGPQHGYWQTEQDNMLETPDLLYTLANGAIIPLYSLYSETRQPTDAHMQTIDTLVVDLQDLGCRVYTYMLTLAACLRAASLHKKRVLVLDRPNPLGLSLLQRGRYERVEGNILDLNLHSFVGWYPLPLRHGLSLGELGRYFIAYDKLSVDYEVVPVEGLSRAHGPAQLRYEPFLIPSPNIPSWESAFFFPAAVCFEGTNVSEGRGTTMPFQLWGAPWFDAQACIRFLLSSEIKALYLRNPDAPAGLFFKEHHFRPTFNKHSGIVCRGVYMGLLKGQEQSLGNINLFGLCLSLLMFCKMYHAQNFQWKDPCGYEYNFVDRPIDLILGKKEWREVLDQCPAVPDFERFCLWRTSEEQAQVFAKEMAPYLIYR